MSGTGEPIPTIPPVPAAPTPTPVAPSSEPIWAKPGVAIYALTIFVVAFAIAYLAKDGGSLQLMIGATISMATQVINYYLGSSSGSAKKTDLLAAAPPIVPTPPVAPKPP